MSATTDTRSPMDAIDSYRAVIVGGRIDWSKQWIDKLGSYVRNGGTLIINSAQVNRLPAELLGVRMTGAAGEAHNAKCLSPNEPEQDLQGQIFRYDRVEAKSAEVLMTVPNGGDPLVTVNRVGRGRVVFVALPDLLGEDERLTPFVAHLLAHLASDATPVKVEGDVEYLINRNASGWVVTLFNDNGVLKPQQGLAQVDRKAVVTVTLSVRGKKIDQAADWTNDRQLEIVAHNGESSILIPIPAGGIAIVELHTPR